MSLIPKITIAGLAAAMRADGTGIAVAITHVAVGTAGYTPGSNQTELVAQVGELIVIADGAIADTNQVHITALLSEATEYWVKEVGFYLSDGTLFAVWSHPNQPLAYKSNGVNILLAFDLLFEALPADSITVNSTGANMSLYYATDFFKMAHAAANSAQRDVDHSDSHDVQAEEIRVLQNAVNHLSRAVLGRDLIT